jgi:hypothetical protein
MARFQIFLVSGTRRLRMGKEDEEVHGDELFAAA